MTPDTEPTEPEPTEPEDDEEGEPEGADELAAHGDPDTPAEPGADPE
jgi:hypothetical protein